MAWTDPSPFKIKYLGVNTGFGATGEWIVYGEHTNKRICSSSISGCFKTTYFGNS